MLISLAHALDRARADWLAGDASAWTRYAACVRLLESVTRRAKSKPVVTFARPTARA